MSSGRARERATSSELAVADGHESTGSPAASELFGHLLVVGVPTEVLEAWQREKGLRSVSNNATVDHEGNSGAPVAPPKPKSVKKHSPQILYQYPSDDVKVPTDPKLM